MSAQINIGQGPGGQSIDFDLEELLATRLLVQGNSGSGKSHLLRRLLEECAGMVQQIVIDPEGDFVSLADHFGHVVIDGSAYSPREIEALAGRVRQHRASVILALDELEVEQQIRCTAIFLTALFDAPREFWFPALVIVDEAQMFAPSAAGEMADDTRRMTLSAMTNLMCRGRKRGLAGIVATQRLAKLAKNVAAEASNFLMGRTFLDIDMQRAADLLGMDRRQADKIRDLQRGQFLGLGPAVSRRPVAVNVGSVRTAGKNAAQALMPLPDAPGDEMEALLNDRLSEALPEHNAPRPLVAHRLATDIEHELSFAPTAFEPATPTISSDAQSDEAQFSDERESAESAEEQDASLPTPASPDIACATDDPPSSIESIIRELASREGATFRSATALFRDFAVRCRQNGVASAHIDIASFRRMFAYEIAGFHRLTGSAKSTVADRINGIDDDVLAPYLAMLVATAVGEPMPDEDRLALLYGSSSPSRIRRLLDHLERQGLIVIREEFGGDRSIIVPGLADCILANEPA